MLPGAGSACKPCWGFVILKYGRVYGTASTNGCITGEKSARWQHERCVCIHYVRGKDLSGRNASASYVSIHIKELHVGARFKSLLSYQVQL